MALVVKKSPIYIQCTMQIMVPSIYVWNTVHLRFWILVLAPISTEILPDKVWIRMTPDPCMGVWVSLWVRIQVGWLRVNTTGWCITTATICPKARSKGSSCDCSLMKNFPWTQFNGVDVFPTRRTIVAIANIWLAVIWPRMIDWALDYLYYYPTYWNPSKLWWCFIDIIKTM